MKQVDDTMLMALVDGQLDPATAAALREAVEHDAELRERVREFQQSAAMVRRALGPRPVSATPERLRELVAGEPAADEPRGAASRQWLALAAGVLLVVGVGIGFIAGRFTVTPAVVTDDFLAGTQWDHLLDSVASGAVTTLESAGRPEPVRVAPLATFKDLDDRYCRSLRLDGAGYRHRALACRTPEGGWMVEAMVRQGETQISEQSLTGDAYVPAAGGFDNAFDKLVQGRMSTAPFTPENEAAAMAGGWR